MNEEMPKMNFAKILSLAQKFMSKPETGIEFLSEYIGDAVSFLENHYQTKIHLQFFNHEIEGKKIPMIGIIDVNDSVYIETMPSVMILDFIKKITAEGKIKQQKLENVNNILDK